MVWPFAVTLAARWSRAQCNWRRWPARSARWTAAQLVTVTFAGVEATVLPES